MADPELSDTEAIALVWEEATLQLSGLLIDSNGSSYRFPSISIAYSLEDVLQQSGGWPNHASWSATSTSSLERVQRALARAAAIGRPFSEGAVVKAPLLARLVDELERQFLLHSEGVTLE